MKVFTIEAVQTSVVRARAMLDAGQLHAGLCGLIYARKDADRVAERALAYRDYSTAAAAVKLASELDAEYESMENG